MHGGGPRVTPGLPLPEEYLRENLELVEEGLPNLLHHVGVVKKAGISPVVCINHFITDTDEAAGARCAVSKHWSLGGEGALELPDAVLVACEEQNGFGLSHNPNLKGVPEKWILPTQDILVYSGAKFLCPLADGISLMPGTASNPGFRHVDVNVETGEVTGLF